MGKIKGMAWKGIEEWVLGMGGEGAWDKVKQGMNVDDHQRLFSGPLLPLNWIDYRAYVQFTLTVDAICGQGDKKSLSELGQSLARRDLKGAYRMFLLMASPKSLIEHAQSIWNQYFSEGQLNLTWLAEKKCPWKSASSPTCPCTMSSFKAPLWPKP